MMWRALRASRSRLQVTCSNCDQSAPRKEAMRIEGALYGILLREESDQITRITLHCII